MPAPTLSPSRARLRDSQAQDVLSPSETAFALGEALRAAPKLPADAPWREVVLFLSSPFTWHLHDRRLFLT